MKYENQETKDGERISTNGYYTGHHKGAVLQDALTGADNAPYYVERTTERFGTITQDAAPNSMPKPITSSGGDEGSGDGVSSGSGSGTGGG